MALRLEAALSPRRSLGNEKSSLVLDPLELPTETLEALRKSIRGDLAETEDLVRPPPGNVLDPVGLENAGESLRSTRARLDEPEPPTVETIAADVNLAYAALVTVIDLVKVHTDAPRVPRRRPPA